MLRRLLFLGLGLWLGVLAAPTPAGADATPLRATVDDPPLRIRAEEGMEAAVREVQRLWPRAATAVADDLGLESPRPVEVVLLGGRTFESWSRGLLPEWGVGYASWPAGPIALNVTEISRGVKTFEEILRHEISHVYLGQRLNGVRPPRWFVEGVAQAQSGEWRFSDTLGLVGSASTGKLPRLHRLTVHFPRGGGSAQLAYRISLQAVLELDRRFPEKGGWRAVLAPAAESGRFDRAFTEVYGLRLPEFGEEVYDRLHSRYGWIAALAGAGTLFTAMTFLFLAGYVRKRAQARRRLREMEEEERRWIDGPVSGEGPDASSASSSDPRG